MNPSPKIIGRLVGSRRSGKRVDQQIADALRDAIRSGELVYGAMLPSTQELARELKANLNSVNRALALLAAEGFLDRRRHYGTIVTAPERKQGRVIGLIGPDLKRESFFVGRHLFRLLEEQLSKRNFRLRCIDNLAELASPDSEVSSQALNALLEELEHYPPTMFILYHFVLERYPELRDYFHLPSVDIGKNAFMPSKRQLFEEGIPYLRRCGCKRVVLVTFSSVLNPDQPFFRLFWDKVIENKMECDAIVELYDTLLGERTAEECQRRLSELLEIRRTKPLRERFDAIIVGDDTAMRGAASALLKAGVDVPGEVRVLVQTNRGINHHYGLHVDRLELPLDEYVEGALSFLDQKILAPSKEPAVTGVLRVLKPSTRAK